MLVPPPAADKPVQPREPLELPPPSHATTKTCSQCGKAKQVDAFLTRTGRDTKKCSTCRGVASASASKKRTAQQAPLSSPTREETVARAFNNHTTPTHNSTASSAGETRPRSFAFNPNAVPFHPLFPSRSTSRILFRSPNNQETVEDTQTRQQLAEMRRRHTSEPRGGEQRSPTSLFSPFMRQRDASPRDRLQRRTSYASITSTQSSHTSQADLDRPYFICEVCEIPRAASRRKYEGINNCVYCHDGDSATVQFVWCLAGEHENSRPSFARSHEVEDLKACNAC